MLRRRGDGDLRQGEDFLMDGCVERMVPTYALFTLFITGGRVSLRFKHF